MSRAVKFVCLGPAVTNNVSIHFLTTYVFLLVFKVPVVSKKIIVSLFFH